MIYEERDYTIYPGKLNTFVGLYRDHGVALQQKYLGTFVAYFTPEIGELNHVVALWGYDSLDKRAEMRAAMLADPEWTKYLGMVDGLIQRQTTRILTPTDFSPLQ